MTVHYSDEAVALHLGDCLDVLTELPDASIDSVVTDPPYGLANTDPAHVTDALVRWINGERDFMPEGAGFMGKAWDAFVPPPAVWDECLRVLKPGGHLLCFAGTRTVDLMGLSIRLAGFEIRDSLAWIYGSGFPKSLDVGKAIDKMAGAVRATIGPGGKSGRQRSSMAGDFAGAWDITAPATPAAQQWQGWGTALKPAFEPVIVARKPFPGTVATNVLTHGTGALNIDGSRVEGGSRPLIASDPKAGRFAGVFREGSSHAGSTTAGRWPANVLLDEGMAARLDQEVGTLTSGKLDRTRISAENKIFGAAPATRSGVYESDSGGPSRFFPVFRYQAKAPTSERPSYEREGTKVAHPTTKPLMLMRWLVRLVTPPGGTVLEPFAGSGTTVEAAILEGFQCVAIEREPDYLPLIRQRIDRAHAQATTTPTADPTLFDEESA